jgi:hypothetical protein
MGKPTIGGYAVIEHFGNDLADNERLAGVVPTRRAARKLEHGLAWSWQSGRRRLLKSLKRRREHYDGEHDTISYAERLAVSPGLYEDIANQLQAARRSHCAHLTNWVLTRDLLSSNFPSYKVGSKNVLCTDKEDNEREAWLDCQRFEAASRFADDDHVCFLEFEVRRGFKCAGVECGTGGKLDRRINRAMERALNLLAAPA